MFHESVPQCGDGVHLCVGKVYTRVGGGGSVHLCVGKVYTCVLVKCTPVCRGSVHLCVGKV